MGTFWLMAGALTLAQPSMAGVAAIQSNVPSWAVREGESTGVLAELVISPAGEVQECAVLEYVGYDRLAEWLCESYVGKAYEPATGPDAERLHARLTTDMAVSFGYRPDKFAPFDLGPEVTLQVAELPAGDPFLDLELALLVDETGAVAACELAKHSAADPAYGAAACEHAGALTLRPLQTGTGDLLPFVTPLRVRFVAETAGEPDEGQP